MAKIKLVARIAQNQLRWEAIYIEEAISIRGLLKQILHAQKVELSHSIAKLNKNIVKSR